MESIVMVVVVEQCSQSPSGGNTYNLLDGNWPEMYYETRKLSTHSDTGHKIVKLCRTTGSLTMCAVDAPGHK